MKTGSSDILTQDYIEVIDSIRYLLETTQTDIELSQRRGETRNEIIDIHQEPFFKSMDQHLLLLEDISTSFDDEEHDAHKEYLRRTIHEFAMLSEFNRRCFNKPLGYAGDYMMMEMIYSDPYQGNTFFEQLINAHSIISLPICEAVRKRGKYSKKTIEETVREKPKASILSVGSGPAWDIREYLKENRGTDARFHLLDQEVRALDFVRNSLNGDSGQVSLYNIKVEKLIRKGLDQKFDLVYCAGLFDYLPESFARRLIRVLYGLLNEGGKLVIGNAGFNPCRIWMEHGVEWYLKYRSAEELAALADGLSPVPSNVTVEEGGMGRLFLFLEVLR